MTEKAFNFKTDVDMNALTKQLGDSLAATIGVDNANVVCKGIMIFFVETNSQMLMSSGLFVEGFSPEDWDDGGDTP